MNQTFEKSIGLMLLTFLVAVGGYVGFLEAASQQCYREGPVATEEESPVATEEESLFGEQVLFFTPTHTPNWLDCSNYCVPGPFPGTDCIEHNMNH